MNFCSQRQVASQAAESEVCWRAWEVTGQKNSGWKTGI